MHEYGLTSDLYQSNVITGVCYHEITRYSLQDLLGHLLHPPNAKSHVYCIASYAMQYTALETVKQVIYVSELRRKAQP